MDAGNYRQELKFICTEAALFHMENKIRHICRPDKHADASGSYLVRSLYFDTFDDRCYSENLAGTDRRKKYRIRIYNDQTDEIHLECKYSRHGLKSKEMCPLTKEQYQALMKNRRISPREELLQRFLAEKSMELLSPKIIVEYVRTPYLFPAGNVRITFDREIRASSRVFDFPGKIAGLQYILPQDVHILEVKYDRMLPGAILELLAAGQDLRRTSFSKYALCRQCCPFPCGPISR